MRRELRRTWAAATAMNAAPARKTYVGPPVMGSDGAAAWTFRMSPATEELDEASRRRIPPSVPPTEEAPRPFRARIETPSEEAVTLRPVWCGEALATLMVVS